MHKLNDNDIVGPDGSWIGFFDEEGNLYPLGSLKDLFG